MKRILKKNINTKRYWNKLLSKKEWGKERGAIYNKLYEYLPKSKNITVLDIGCATGHGIIALAKKLPNIKFEACDFSEKGIILANKLYGNKIRFFIHDLSKDKLNKKYDYILFVETLEHIEKPKEAIEKYLKYCNKRILVTVPYKEQGWKEHVYYFNENSFKDIKEFKEFHVFKKPKANTEIILYIFDK